MGPIARNEKDDLDRNKNPLEFNKHQDIVARTVTCCAALLLYFILITVT